MRVFNEDRTEERERDVCVRLVLTETSGETDLYLTDDPSVVVRVCIFIHGCVERGTVLRSRRYPACVQMCVFAIFRVPTKHVPDRASDKMSA